MVDENSAAGKAMLRKTGFSRVTRISALKIF
jgi:hypothetical protein